MSRKISTIHDLLHQYNDLIVNQRDKGTSFEQLMKSYLELDPLYKDQFKKVYMWSEWPYGATKQDHGIDLVGEGVDGEFTAIQCKFFAPTYQIQKKDIDSFFTESGKTFQVNGKKKSFHRRILISTSDKWSLPAEKALSGQTIPVSRIHIRELEKSPIDWSQFTLGKPEDLKLKDKKTLRNHQEEAIENILKGYKSSDRGKLIMACGTGKTFTALKLAEKIGKRNGLILFLVPSISLLSQTLREWTAEAESSFHAFAVCSDSKVGKYKEDISKHDLAIPASTDTNSLLKGLDRTKESKKMSVIFSTYQSIEVISRAQKKGLDEFDLIICDEAHRTTGATAADKDDSHFVKIHNQNFIKGKKRLYMTATPRIFGDAVKTKAGAAGAVLYSMDDENLFGSEFHRLGFGRAVNDDLLTDYKVLVLAIDESIIDASFQRSFADENNEIPLEDVAKIIGCWNGLAKRLVEEEVPGENLKPMRRAVAFARSIEDSKRIVSMFGSVVNEYINKYPNMRKTLKCDLEHVDGTFNVLSRNEKLDWLKEDVPENECRIISNARCLSEGVDVPALDAVMFLNSRDSMVDVVQSVGRIMRKSEGKKYGYVILPIGIPAGVPPEEALKDNKKYKVVWQVLQALRAHDDRFDAEVNKIDLNKNHSKTIQVIGVGGGQEGDSDGESEPTQLSLNLNQIEEWKDAIYGKIVIKCGTRPYWENWAADVAKIAERHTKQIKKILDSGDKKANESFSKFLGGIRQNLNPEISDNDAVEMLSQQLVTKPVFDALFEHYKFTEENPVSQTMQLVLKVFEDAIKKEDAKTLNAFYQSVKMRVRGINNSEARQRVIKELYDRFFNIAFKKMAERLGIVYTPIEVVDFIVNSVEDIMRDEFGKSLSDEGINILDPFTGTGTFIVRLLQSGIIKKEDLERKFKSEIFSNELVLLAYYIASVNIEETYHDLVGGNYVPFEGAVLTDTFQLTEEKLQLEMLNVALPKNHKRAEKQKEKRVFVIISNPPYSSGQSSGNDNNQNLEYPCLDEKIRSSYAKESTATLKNSLYDSYVRSIKWATERIGSEGVIGFVTNGSFISNNAADGLRKTLVKDFSKIYYFNLRGNARTSGEQRKKEKGNIFGEGTRAPIGITILVKSMKASKKASVYYHDIGDYLSRADKLKIISNYKTIKNINWIKIEPNESGDWINKRNEEFSSYINIGNKKEKNEKCIFDIYSRGVGTSRDGWVINYSKEKLVKNIPKFIAFYRSNLEKLEKLPSSKVKDKKFSIADFVETNEEKIKWTRGLLNNLSSKKDIEFEESLIRKVQYRPFCRQNLYFNSQLVEMMGISRKFFPIESMENISFSVTGVGSSIKFSTLCGKIIPDNELISKGQCFPMYYFQEENGKLIKKDGVSDYAKFKFQELLKDKSISKKDIFYYVYGLLHSPIYRQKYEYDLRKMLPRIPVLKEFKLYSKAGRELANIHLNYETIEPYDLIEEIRNDAPSDKSKIFKVSLSGMRFSRAKNVIDKTAIIFNEYVTIKNIPKSAYNYVVNGKSAIEWIMDRYKITIDKKSGIKNDPNEWCDDPRYIIDLVKRVVTLSMETNRIVSEFPPFEIIETDK